jgi:anti-anti-sigma factor
MEADDTLAEADERFGQPFGADELPPETPFALRTARRDGVVWLALGGELDAFTAPTLRAELANAAKAGEILVLDLRGLSFMDSSGLAVVLGAHERAERSGGEPVRMVIEGSVPVETLFQTIGAGEHLHLIRGPEDLSGTGREP